MHCWIKQIIVCQNSVDSIQILILTSYECYDDVLKFKRSSDVFNIHVNKMPLVLLLTAINFYIFKLKLDGAMFVNIKRVLSLFIVIGVCNLQLV